MLNISHSEDNPTISMGSATDYINYKGVYNMAQKIRLGVIGAGRIGKLHIKNIVNHIMEAEVKAIADVFAEDLKGWAGELGVKKVTSDYRDILDDSEIDAVLICSSTDTHADFVIEAAKTGKHIFCEKPVDLSIEKVKKALQAVKEAGVKFQIGFNRRFDHNHKSVRDAVKEGKIGDPHIIKITSRDPAPPPIDYVKVSGGIFKDMTIHDFDMVRFLSGSEVSEVYAVGNVLIDKAIGDVGDLDTAVITLKFENGAIGIIDNSRKAVYGYDQRVEVFGSKGCVMNENDTPSTTVLLNSEMVTSDKPKYFFLERYNDSYISEMKEFVDSILFDKTPSVTDEDAINPLIIAEAAIKSWKEHRPVKIEEVQG